MATPNAKKRVLFWDEDTSERTNEDKAHSVFTSWYEYQDEFAIYRQELLTATAQNKHQQKFSEILGKLLERLTLVTDVKAKEFLQDALITPQLWNCSTLDREVVNALRLGAANLLNQNKCWLALRVIRHLFYQFPAVETKADHPTTNPKQTLELLCLINENVLWSRGNHNNSDQELVLKAIVRQEPMMNFPKLVREAERELKEQQSSLKLAKVYKDTDRKTKESIARQLIQFHHDKDNPSQFFFWLHELLALNPKLNLTGPKLLAQIRSMAGKSRHLGMFGSYDHWEQFLGTKMNSYDEKEMHSWIRADLKKACEKEQLPEDFWQSAYLTFTSPFNHGNDGLLGTDLPQTPSLSSSSYAQMHTHPNANFSRKGESKVTDTTLPKHTFSVFALDPNQDGTPGYTLRDDDLLDFPEFEADFSQFSPPEEKEPSSWLDKFVKTVS